MILIIINEVSIRWTVTITIVHHINIKDNGFDLLFSFFFIALFYYDHKLNRWITEWLLINYLIFYLFTLLFHVIVYLNFLQFNFYFSKTNPIQSQSTQFFVEISRYFDYFFVCLIHCLYCKTKYILLFSRSTFKHFIHCSISTKPISEFTMFFFVFFGFYFFFCSDASNYFHCNVTDKF